MPNLKTSELPEVVDIEESALFAVSQPLGGSPSTFESNKITLLDLRTAIGVSIQKRTVLAREMRASSVGGAGALTSQTSFSSSAAYPDYEYIPFTNTGPTSASFSLILPGYWNTGSFAFNVLYTQAADTAGTGVAFALRATCLDAGMSYATLLSDPTYSFGTGAGSDETQYVTALSAASLLPEGANSGEDTIIHFRLTRETNFGSPADTVDTIEAAVRVLGLQLYFGTNSGTEPVAL